MKLKLYSFIYLLILHIAPLSGANLNVASDININADSDIDFDANANINSHVNQKESDQSFWELGAGVFAISTPHYAGSDQSEFYLLPFPFINYQSKQFSLNREGIKGHLLQTSKWDFDLSFAGTFPVDSNDNRTRQGMPDLDWVGLGGPALTYLLNQNKTDTLKLILPVRFAVSTNFNSIDYVGWESVPSLRWQRNLNKQGVEWQLISAVSFFYASEKYNNYTYAVDNQYATSDRPAYQSDSGNAGYEFVLGATRRHKNFWMGSFLRYRSLEGSIVEDSPLVKQKENYYIGFSLAWIVQSSND